MRAVLIFVILVAAATASPTGTCESSQSTVTSISKTTTCTYSTTSLPPMIPKEWKIKSFSSQYVSHGNHLIDYCRTISTLIIVFVSPSNLSCNGPVFHLLEFEYRSADRTITSRLFACFFFFFCEPSNSQFQ